MFRAARWLVVAPVVLFVFATMMASCGGGGGCSGSFNSFGIFVSGVCPGASPSPGYTLQSITICQGTEPSPTPTPTPAPSPTKKQPTPTPTACPAATSTAVAVGDETGFLAQGFLTKKKKSKYQDLTNAVGTLWTSADQVGTNVLLPPVAGQGGIYTGANTGCACITANAGGISSLPVSVAVGSPAPVCPACPTPSATPTATALPAHALSAPTPALSSPSSNGSVFSWVYDAGSPARGPIGAGPDGHAYFITADSMLHALDSHGNEVFNRPAGGVAPAVAPDGTVFVQGTTTWIYALTNDGRPKWQVDLKSAASPLAATNATVYVSTGSDVASVSAPGHVDWRVPAGPAAAGVVIPGGVVVAQDGGGLTALSASGGRLWTFSPAGGFAGGLAASGDVIYAGSRSGSMYAIGTANGSEQWQIDSPAPVVAGPVANDSGAVFFGSDKLYALNPDGSVSWTAAAPTAFGIALDSVGGVLEARPDGSVSLFDALGGIVSSTRSTGRVARTGSSPWGLSYVAASDGRFYAIK
jgi:outer membrane protein assembly factor BamB